MRLFLLPTATELQGCWELCRLHNNIGFWVVWLPTCWSIAMVYRAQPELSGSEALLRAAVYVPLCFGVKSLVSQCSSLGSPHHLRLIQIMTIDDLLDYDIDALVERTKNRPLPPWCNNTGTCLDIFWNASDPGGMSGHNDLEHNRPLYLHGGLATLHYVPRVQALDESCPDSSGQSLATRSEEEKLTSDQGLMFKVGIFMGWSDLSLDGSIPWNTLIPIYLGACLWTITYETVYQHQDKIDDLKIGIKSPALLCGGYTIPICVTTALAFLAFWPMAVR
ncbi:hypothetical protein B0H14DRAFT_831611 [Mycena olivaceomarginata]|nr:hypothetical protein B0H14DRAFT_831611 [Mycena olivaceomarginata]